MDESIKKMAELLRSGATMLKDACPVCNSPLFRFEDKVTCAKCGKQFSNVSSTSSPQLESIKNSVPRIISTILTKLGEVETEVGRTTDFNKLLQLAKLMLTLLKILRLLDELGKPRQNGLNR